MNWNVVERSDRELWVRLTPVAMVLFGQVSLHLCTFNDPYQKWKAKMQCISNTQLSCHVWNKRWEKHNAPNIYVAMLGSYVQLRTHQVATSYGIMGIHLTVILVTIVWLGTTMIMTSLSSCVNVTCQLDWTLGYQRIWLFWVPCKDA